MVARGQVHFVDDLGEGSSGEAEWAALHAALRLAHDLALPAFDLLGDSRAVILAASAGLTAEARRFAELAAPHPPRRLRWVPRAQNLAGIALDARRR